MSCLQPTAKQLALEIIQTGEVMARLYRVAAQWFSQFSLRTVSYKPSLTNTGSDELLTTIRHLHFRF